MTWPRGTVVVQLTRREAEGLAQLVARYELQDPSALGRAGLTAGEVADWQMDRRQRLDDLVRVLAGKQRGRPRAPTSTYVLHRDALTEFRNSISVLTVPAWLRPACQRMSAGRIAKRKGPPRYSGRALVLQVANGGPDARNLRRFRRRLEEERRQEQATEKRLADLSANSAPPMSRDVVALVASTLRF